CLLCASSAAISWFAFAALPQLVFELEFASQQAARIIRHALQPLLDCVGMLVGRRVAWARAEIHRLVLAALSLLSRQRAIHFFTELLLGIATALGVFVCVAIGSRRVRVGTLRRSILRTVRALALLLLIRSLVVAALLILLILAVLPGLLIL